MFVAASLSIVSAESFFNEVNLKVLIVFLVRHGDVPVPTDTVGLISPDQDLCIAQGYNVDCNPQPSHVC